MDLRELQERLHELNQEYKDKGPNVDSKLSWLREDLSKLTDSKLTVILAKDYGSRNGLNEYVIADNVEVEERSEEE